MGNCCGSLFGTRSIATRRSDGWAATGIVGLRDEKLKELPLSLKSVASKITAIDASINQIRSLPSFLPDFSQLQRLTLTKNELVTLPESFSHLRNLKVLILDSNKISTFPESLCALIHLEKLSLSSNCLTTVPSDVSLLRALKELDISSNRIDTISVDFKSLPDVEIINFSNNSLTELPISLQHCSRLKQLLCEHNKLSSIPSEILIECVSLHTLTLDGNRLNIEDFEETEGYKEFEKRRREKANKAISANVMLGEGTLNEAVSRRV